MPAAHPELMPTLARVPGDVTICEWGYEANHPFDERLSKLGEAGAKFWVCPGTSSWMSITGRAVDMLGNVRNAAEAGVAHGSRGFLVTDWGDFGNHQYLPVSEPGLAAGAALSWCAASHDDMELGDLATMLDAHAFDDGASEMGAAIIALGSVHRLITPQPPNMSALVSLILFPQWSVGRGPTRGLTDEELDAVEGSLTSAKAALKRARPDRPDGQLVVDELHAAASWLELACTDARARLAGDGTVGSIGEPERVVLAARCDELTEEHRRLWLARNRPGGLDDSAAWLEHLRGCYASGRADAGWFGPAG
jgi:hypothetical protein